MSLPIQPTPTLHGKDARRFAKLIKENEEGKHNVSKKDYLRAKKVYEEMKSKGNCDL
jgi:hypothetical protein